MGDDNRDNLVNEIPNSPDIPESLIKDSSVQVRQTKFDGQVLDDNDKPLIQTSENSVKTIEIPADSKVLETLSKGPESQSVTWFASFWLRAIRRAIKSGWHVVVKKS